MIFLPRSKNKFVGAENNDEQTTRERSVNCTFFERSVLLCLSCLTVCLDIVQCSAASPGSCWTHGPDATLSRWHPRPVPSGSPSRLQSPAPWRTGTHCTLHANLL